MKQLPSQQLLVHQLSDTEFSAVWFWFSLTETYTLYPKLVRGTQRFRDRAQWGLTWLQHQYTINPGFGMCLCALLRLLLRAFWPNDMGRHHQWECVRHTL